MAVPGTCDRNVAVVETAALLLIGPGLMLGSYASLVVPAGVLAVWAWSVARTGRAWPRTDLNGPIAALLVLTAASLVVSQIYTADVRTPLPKVTTMVYAVAWFVALVRWRGAGLQAETIALVLVGVCLGVALIGLLTVNWQTKFAALSAITLRLPHLSPGTADGGLHPNAVAGTLVLLMPLCLALRRSTVARAAGLAVLAISVAVLVLTQSRGGWLAAIAGTLTLLLFRVPVLRSRPAVALLIAFGIGSVAVALWAWYPSAAPLGADLTEKRMARFELWRIGWLFVKEFFWTGAGFNGFRHLAVGRYPSPYQYYGIDIAHPHNMWLSVAVDFGIAGVLTYLALWWKALGRLGRVIAAAGPGSLIAQCLLAGWVAFWVFGLADAIPLGTKLGTALWGAFALSQCLAAPAYNGRSGSDG